VRQFNGAMSALPYQVQHEAARYLGLFRVGSRGLSWKRALRILQELQDLVGAGTVHWEGGETRPAPPALWAEVMGEMCEKGKRELDSHNYLRKVVWTKARGLAAEAEAEAGRAKMKKHPQMGADVDPGESRPKKRGCFTCEAFKPPKRCGAKSRPVSGNQMLGCEKWKEKPASAVGNLMDALVENIHHGEHEE
jgi:hypothetical protein